MHSPIIVYLSCREFIWYQMKLTPSPKNLHDSAFHLRFMAIGNYGPVEIYMKGIGSLTT